MAQQLHRVAASGNPRPFDMRALLRLAIWGAAAAASLLIAVLAGYSNPAAQRLMGTLAAAMGQSQRRAEAPSTARSAEAENETRRLADTVRVLVADRNELVTRIRSIEQSLEDVTGTINRQTVAASALPPPPSPTTDASVLFSPPATPPATMQTVSPRPGSSPGLTAAFPEDPKSMPNWVATLPEIGWSAEADLLKPKIEPKIELRTEFGVDIGSAVNFDALRVLWNSTKASHAALLDGLSPLVSTRENSKSRTAELRLIIGPLPDAEAAARLCAALAAARRSCQPTPFVGERFALASPEPERKPAPAAERKPAAAPAAAPAPARQPARATP
jgi:hypothetical protein